MKKEQSMPNFIKNEEDILEFWNNNNCFEKLVEKNKDSGKYFRFLDGPITANNKMGVHHAWNRSLKDVMLKYKAMRGYGAHYQCGFDSQGLWVEVETEKELGLKDKRDIQNFGLDKFTKACMDRVKKYSGIITDQSKRLGQWMDWDNSYFTNSDENITSNWYFLKKCYENGWLVQKYRPMPWCSHCGTSLSEHELSDSYMDMTHTAVFFKLPIKNTDMEILVWTTTPWTLSANVAVAVNPQLEYSICNIKGSDKKLIVCTSCTKVLKGELESVQKCVLGSELVGLEYETCFPWLEKQNFVHKIVAWDMVDSTEGSGAVHIAPGCGVEDFELGQTLDLPMICPVNENGIFFDDFDFLAGKETTEVADMVFEKLKAQNKLFYTHSYTHRYPICWRCKKPLIFRLTKEWYIKADEIRPQLIKACDDVVWQPEYLKKRMLDWLNNMGDWSISRKRFYGLPLPIYPCPKCGKVTVVGSLEELEKLSSKAEVDALPHLHRPYIDDIKITCPHCQAKVERISEVGDCWLDAGITPFSTKKYFTDRAFWEKNFPIECVCEMKEQIRLWFYSLLFMSVTLVGKAPYQKVIGFAALVAEDGSKFSKSGKNNISFFDAADKIGADVIRYMFASNNMLNDTRFGFSIGDEIRRKLLGLWNAYVFFNTYAVLDNPKIDGFKPNVDSLNLSDKYILERLNQFLQNAIKYYDNQSFNLIVKEFEIVVDDLTNWYIRTNRKRFWKSGDVEDKTNAYWTLYTAIKTLCQAMAPIIPFMTEYIWQNMVRELEPNSPQSIILSDFPQTAFEFDAKDIVKNTQITKEIIATAQKLRNEAQIKIKQPLKTLYVVCDDQTKIACIQNMDVIKDELNIKQIVFENDRQKFNTSFLGVNFKTAGAVLKGDVQKLKQLLLDADQLQMQQYVDMFNSGSVQTPFGDLQADLFVLQNKPKPDFLIDTQGDTTLVLDITIDESLMIEGLYRELTRQIQLCRRQADYKVEDRIFADIQTDGETLKKVLEIFGEKIKQEALILDIKKLEKYDFEATCEIGDETVVIKLKK